MWDYRQGNDYKAISHTHWDKKWEPKVLTSRGFHDLLTVGKEEDRGF